MFSNYSRKIEEDGIPLNLFYEVSITQIANPEKYTTLTKKLQTNIPNEYRYRSPQQNISKPNLIIYEKNIHIHIYIHTHTHTHTHTQYCIRIYVRGFPGGDTGKEPACQSRRIRRCEFDPWVGKIPGKGNGQLLVFLPGKFHGQRSVAGYSLKDCQESGTTELTHTHTQCKESHTMVKWDLFEQCKDSSIYANS